MAEIFISYKSERRKAAEHLAQILRCYGYSVWFDYSLINGRDFGLQIDAKVREAKAVVVLWCAKSAGSRWVAEEADLAHSLGSLAPVMIEKCELPVGFRRLDYIDLTGWDGAPRSHLLDKLLDELEQKTGRAPQLNLRAVRDYEETWRRFKAPSLKAFALEAPLDAAESDRKLPERAAAKESPAAPAASGRKDESGGNHLWTLAAQEWPAVRDSRDIARLRRFEASFAGTYYAGEAQALREALEAENSRLAQAQAQEDRWRTEGRIHISGVIAHGAPEGWFLPGAGKTEWFQDFAGGPEMAVVPAGAFMMGTAAAEIEALCKEYKGWANSIKREGPQRRVAIAEPFAVGRFAVTVGEYMAGVKDGGCKPPQWLEEGSSYNIKTGSDDHYKKLGDALTGDRYPIVGVSWHDASAYAAWLSSKTGKSYRLLSEAEWEYACRAGTTASFWWGSSISTEQANYDGNFTFGGGKEGEHRQRTLPVKSFQPNPWGLYQVHGNVWEWCEDFWNETHEGAPSDGLARATGDSAFRALRGGSWRDVPVNLRAASRIGVSPDFRYLDAGFRLARALLTP
jgi:formylglycine-generating enzyme required for sulfatase activity